MTRELYIIVGTTLISGLSASTALYLLHRKIAEHVEFFKQWLHDVETAKQVGDSTLRAGILEESNAIRARIRMVRDELGTELREALTHFDKQAEVLKASAEDLRNHAKSVHDEAQASKNSVTRVVPQR